MNTTDTPATKTKPVTELVDGMSHIRVEPADEQVLRRVQHIAELLDNRFEVPGLKTKIGWDGIIGLVPGIGDLLTMGVSAYIVYLAKQTGVPKHVIAKMLWNASVDVMAGVVPVVGDLADFAWKSNLKNARLLEKHLKQQASETRES